MKTTNSRLQKTETISLTSLLLFVAAILMVTTNANAIEKITHTNAGTEAMAELIATENEAGISLEHWMLNESNFTYSFETTADNEASLELESWMAEAVLFEAAFSLENETEEELAVSEWMTSESNFLPAFSLETESEETMELEAWMLGETSFGAMMNTEAETEAALDVEEWMLNNNAFLPAFAIESDIEEALETESWMLNDTTFKPAEKKINEAEPLALIVDKKNKTIGVNFPNAQFGRRTFILVEMEDPKLELEKWMVDDKVWKVKK